MSHEKYIKRCIQLAKNGNGNVYPNPMVGSVIVYQGKIIGEGWHQKAGEAHAEVNAINSVKDKSLLPHSTIYVSLEPCSHFGKTPPCSDLIIQHKIPNVIIGIQDPFSEVSGRGIKKLKEAGCDVVVGVLEKECFELNKRFFTYHIQKRPFIILKWAQSADGYLAPLQQNNRTPVWLSNTYSKQQVHKQRSIEQAILVGTDTVIKDNPSLTTREWYGNNPVRIIIDRNDRIPLDSTIFNGTVKTIIFTNSIKENIANIDFVHIENSNDLLTQICNYLHHIGIQSLIIEGGKKTLETFIKKGLWDEAYVYKATYVYLKDGIFAPAIKKPNSGQKEIHNNFLFLFKND